MLLRFLTLKALNPLLCGVLLFVFACQSSSARKAKEPEEAEIAEQQEEVGEDEPAEEPVSNLEAIAIDPIFGIALAKRGSIQKRLDTLQKGYSKSKNPKDLIKIATNLVRNRNYAGAVKLTRRIISNPELAEQAKNILFIAIVSQGQKNHARYLGKVIGKSRKPWAQNVLGIAHYSVGEFNEASTAFQSALRADPKFLPARLNACSLFLKFGKSDLASRCITQGRDASGNLTVFKTMRAMVEAIKGNEKKALADLKSLAKAGPNPLALINAAYISKRRGKESEAQLHFEKFRALFDKYEGLGFNALQRIDEQFQAIEAKGRNIVFTPIPSQLEETQRL